MQPNRHIRVLIALAILIALLTIAHLVLTRTPPDPISRVDSLLLAGRFYDALRLTRAEYQDTPDAELALRLGILRMLRGETQAAETMLRYTADTSTQSESRAAAQLYLGVLLLRNGQGETAQRHWQLIPNASPFAAAAELLAADAMLASGNQAAAHERYQRVTQAQLPSVWKSYAVFRLAFLDGIQGDWETTRTTLNEPISPGNEPDFRIQALLAPLLPPLAPDLSERLSSAAAQTDSAEHAWQVALIARDLGLDNIADAQLQTIPPISQHMSSAVVLQGDLARTPKRRSEVIAQLALLHVQYPQDIRFVYALGLLHIAGNQLALAQQTYSDMQQAWPSDARTAIFAAQLAFSQRDYIEAMTQWERAIERATPDLRADYARAAAQFSLDSLYAVCTTGRAFADKAVLWQPKNSQNRRILAIVAARCGDNETVLAQIEAIAPAERDAELWFILGKAAYQQRMIDEARAALIASTDLAPASEWRVQAETLLSTLPDTLEQQP